MERYVKAEILADNDENLASALLANKVQEEQAVLDLEFPGDPRVFYKGRRVKLKVTDRDNGLITYTGVIVKLVKKTNVNSLHLEDVRKQEVIQRREDVKAYVNYKGSISALLYPELGNIPIIVKDISAGGMCFTAEKDLDKDIVFLHVIPVTKLPIVVRLSIVRKSRDEVENTFVYGCRFLGVKPMEEEYIRAFVFRAQVRKRKV